MANVGHELALTHTRHLSRPSGQDRPQPMTHAICNDNAACLVHRRCASVSTSNNTCTAAVWSVRTALPCRAHRTTSHVSMGGMSASTERSRFQSHGMQHACCQYWKSPELLLTPALLSRHSCTRRPCACNSGRLPFLVHTHANRFGSVQPPIN